MEMPKWMFQDPSRHVDYIRELRERYEALQPENKERKAKENLEKMFKGSRHDKDQDRA